MSTPHDSSAFAVPFDSAQGGLQRALLSPTLATPRDTVEFPLTPLPDSLLLRATLSSLEHSTSTLKRLSKNVLASTAAVLALYEQMDKAEDELFAGLGDLGRWLEMGYGVQVAQRQTRGSGGLKGSHDASPQSQGVWDDEGGIRKLKREKRRREKEELEMRVEGAVQAVKGELKRQGLAGGHAHAKFEVSRSFIIVLRADQQADHRSKPPSITTTRHRPTSHPSLQLPPPSVPRLIPILPHPPHPPRHPRLISTNRTRLISSLYLRLIWLRPYD
jgi:hypothetical protein